MKSNSIFFSILLLSILNISGICQETDNYVRGSLIELNDNGAWSWFMDERVIVDQGKLIVGSVRAIGNDEANLTHPDWGNIEVAVYDIGSGRSDKIILHPHLEQDDHNNPAFYVLPDGRYLAIYTKHAVERKIYYRISEPGDPLSWSAAKVFISPGEDRTYGGDNVTYSNIFRLDNGRIYNFYRGFSHDPNYIYSDDDGLTWQYGGRLMMGKDGYSPYFKYAYCKENNAVHFVATEDHPRNYDNSLYHGYLKDEVIHKSNGQKLAELSKSTDVEVASWDLTKVFQGDSDHVAWMVDIELDDNCYPGILFSVQVDGRDLPPRQGGMDIRYYYARWNGEEWQSNEIAYAGTRLYPFEDDYSGLGAIDPNNPDIVYISTDADPNHGKPLISKADGKRHYEIFKGISADFGKSWVWEPITANSTCDNLRPIVPRWKDERTALVWMRGRYVENHGEWYTSVVGLILP